MVCRTLFPKRILRVGKVLDMTDKETLRKRILAVRKGLDEETKKRLGRIICQKLLDSSLYKEAKTVMSYMDFRNEAPTEVLNRACLSDGKNLLLPYCIDDKNMHAVKAELLPDESFTDRFGIRVPKNALEYVWDPKRIDLLVVPGVVFNRKCYRIGYGKGFYDRFLTLVKPDCIKVGFAYEFQIVDDHFQRDYDIPTDILISEKRVYYNENSGVGL